MKKDYLYIFVHLHKTGGTTLNKHIEKKFKKDEVLFLYYDKLGLDPFTHKKQSYTQLAKKGILKLSKSERNKIKIISGHFLPNGIEKYFKGKTTRYITIIRNPYNRARSFYNYFMTLYQKEDKSGKSKKLYDSFLKIKGEVPTFPLWLKEKYSDPKGSVIPRPMDMYYSALGYKLSDFYFIGLTEKLNYDMPFLLHLLGIRKFFLNRNISQNYINKKYPRAKVMFEKKYKKAMKLYQKAVLLNKKFKDDYSGFYSIVKAVNKKRKMLTPITQVLFDFVESLRMLSSLLRKKSRIYNRFMDLLKGKQY